TDAGREHPLCRSGGGPGGKVEITDRSQGRGWICQGKTHHAGSVRPFRSEGLEAIPVPKRHPQISEGRATGICSHRYAAVVLSRQISMADKKRILFVDDEPQITRVLRTSLAGSGYDVRTADDGHAGLRVAREWQPDLVVTDISMPNMSGIELCRQLRAESALPIIVLSVKGEEKTKVE